MQQAEAMVNGQAPLLAEINVSILITVPDFLLHQSCVMYWLYYSTLVTWTCQSCYHYASLRQCLIQVLKVESIGAQGHIMWVTTIVPLWVNIEEIYSCTITPWCVISHYLMSLLHYNYFNPAFCLILEECVTFLVSGLILWELELARGKGRL